MTKLSLTLVAAASTLLASSTFAATPCPADVTTKALAVVTNVTNLNTCAPGSKWKLANLFQAANLSATDFLTFCNATECMHPMHTVLDAIPDNCVATYNGTSIVLADAISAVHNKCHEELHKALGSHADDHDDDDDDDDDHSKANDTHSNATAANKVPSPAPAATPKSAATAVSSVTLTAAIVVVTAASTISALVL